MGCNSRHTNVIVIGMAGSGKTTLIQRLNSYLRSRKMVPYLMNLDPAVDDLHFKVNIDIRDTVDYKAVMRQYNLGPNGGIVTSLNLFATKFDQVLDLLEKRSDKIDILYKTQLPFILVFNKTDVISHKFALEWMNDFQLLQEELQEDMSYMATFVSSLCLVLDEFYKNLHTVGVSSVTGDGFEDLLNSLEKARQEYKKEFWPIMEKRAAQKNDKAQKEKMKNLMKLMKDMDLDGKTKNCSYKKHDVNDDDENKNNGVGSKDDVEVKNNIQGNT